MRMTTHDIRIPVASSVSSAVIDPVRALRFVERAAAGAGVLFVGVVRDHDHGRSVTSLEYLAHPSAAAVLCATVQEALPSHPGVLAVHAQHRTGPLRIGESAFVVAVASAHRGAAFAACEDIVEQAKASVPIWKRQVFTDGTEEWVNCP
jgi:molybdopterin synthase catalytic subunit